MHDFLEKKAEEKMKYFWYEQTSFGLFYFLEENGFLLKLQLVQKEEKDKQATNGCQKCTPLIQKACMELHEYLKGQRKYFDIPLCPQGTSFQQKVWKKLLEIPYGETRTYQEIAQAIGNAKASRAVGMANHHNPIVIMIPCHRVIGKNGKLTGYALGLEQKEKLLTLEAIDSK